MDKDKAELDRVCNQLYEQLYMYTRKGRSWPASLGQSLADMPVRAMADILNRLEVRSRVYPRETANREGLPWRARFADEEDRAARSLATRSQMLHFLTRQPKRLQQRLMHIYQIRLMPDRLKRLAYSFYSLSYLRRREDGAFGTSERFVPLHEARALVLFLRDHRFHGTVVAPMWDLKVLRWEVNLDTHQVFLGGNYQGGNGVPCSRCTDAWLFNYSPVAVEDHRWCIYEGRTGMVAAGLDMQWGVEEAAAGGRGQYPSAPTFPAVYLGFRAADTVLPDMEAPGLRSAAHREVLLWVKAGRPKTWLRLPALVQRRDTDVKLAAMGRSLPPIGDSVRDPGNCWEDTAKPLTGAEQEFLLLTVRASYEAEHQGLTLVPMSFFTPGNPEKPLLNCVRMYLDFRGLLGKASTDTRFDQCREPSLAKVQTVYLPARDCLTGTAGGVDYDFLSVRPMAAHKFSEARTE